MAKRIAVVGAGPVGALAALYAAERGYEVDVYELREGAAPLNFTKSINLALSERGINGLRSAGHDGLLEEVLSQTIPMHGRMVHVKSATGALIEQSQVYDVHGRFQRSVDRGALNVCLLNELEKLPQVHLHFQHKLTGADFNKKKAWFEVRDNNTPKDSRDRHQEIEISFDLMLGCDGAHSAVRYHMMKFARMNYTQEYIDCLWSEFTMPPTSNNEYAISPNHLHIWPGGDKMFIALPNLDKSFVCTLFGPVSFFQQLESSLDDDNDTNLIETFNTHFPGIVPNLITKPDLINQFKQNPHLPLINIKCSPHHYSSAVAILGDAANAMVPFYGQGMNAGLESVRVLFENLDNPNNQSTPEQALSNYTSTRTPDTHAIADLALQNYVEMSSSVTDPLYKTRKWIEERLDKYLPSLGWSTQYSRVSFGNTPYSEVIKQSAYQKKVLQTFTTVLGSISGGVVLWVLLVVAKRRGLLERVLRAWNRR